MRILVTHVTRMARGFCCVAGISEGDHSHIRPVIGQRLTTDLLGPEGVFDFGTIVDLGRVHPAGHTPPEVEDHLFQPERARRLGYVSPARLWDLLSSTASDSLYEIFGTELEPQGQRASVGVLQGVASLGVYRPLAGCELTLRSGDEHDSIRVRLPAEGLDLSLTDARYYTNALQDPDRERLAAAVSDINTGIEVLLGVGLTRPFASSPELPERHWLQVNALHLASAPSLRLR